MPCMELFAEQDAAYRASVLPPDRWQRVSVEAGITKGWREWIGDRGVAVGIDRVGASAPGEVVLERLGINADNVARAAKSVLATAK
jgi:transketolase